VFLYMLLLLGRVLCWVDHCYATSALMRMVPAAVVVMAVALVPLLPRQLAVQAGRQLAPPVQRWLTATAQRSMHSRSLLLCYGRCLGQTLFVTRHL
jgi:hypothetical protein